MSRLIAFADDITSRSRTKHNRFPCQVLLHGLEFAVESLHFQFVRGEAVWMNLRLCPWVEPILVEKV